MSTDRNPVVAACLPPGRDDIFVAPHEMECGVNSCLLNLNAVGMASLFLLYFPLILPQNKPPVFLRILIECMNYSS
ncbi:MAG: hypothetical protein ACQER7_01705 [Bacteroidota bacterium]